MKKTNAILGVLVCILVLLAGCNTSSGTAESEKPESAVTQDDFQTVSSFDADDTFSFSELQPTQVEPYINPLTFTNEISEFAFVVTWTHSGSSVEVGLVAQDGKEYLMKVSGGSATGTIKDIPAGTYQVFLRNSENNLEHTENTNVSGAVAFDY